MKKLILLLIVSIAIFATSCDCGQKKIVEKPARTNVFDADDYLASSSEDYDFEEGYSSDYISESEISTGSNSYWYVYITKANDWRGYTTIKLNTPYFSLVAAQKEIAKQWTSIKEDDYVGITFYAQITKKGHDEYQESE